MKLRAVAYTLAGLIMFGAQPLIAASDAVAAMADIVIGLKHFPSDAAKTQLQAIVESTETSAAEKHIATAILNVEHAAQPEDRAKLAAIAADEDAPADVRTLATAVLNINHFPSPDDVEALERIMAR